MNIFAGIGKIIDVQTNSSVLKFTLAVQQEKPCYVPCLIFDPKDEVKELMEQLQDSKQLVWLQGRMSSYEFEYRGSKKSKITVVTYAKRIKTI